MLTLAANLNSVFIAIVKINKVPRKYVPYIAFLVEVAMAEWLRRRTKDLVVLDGVGSSPTPGQIYR